MNKAIATVAFVLSFMASINGQGGPYQFYSYNYPLYAIGAKKSNNEAYIVDTEPDSFILVPGLSGATGSVSFASVRDPSRYLRHQGYILRLHAFRDETLFKNDASFLPRPDLFYPGYTVYESVNFRRHYIRHQGYRLRISREDNSQLLHKDASFLVHSPKKCETKRDGPFLFRSQNFPTYVIGIKRSSEAWIVNNKNEHHEFFLVSPGLTGTPGSVSFRSKTHANSYLRHQSYRLFLHPYKNEDLYQKDATFMPRPGLFFSGYTVYESINYRNYYIRHQGYRLKISREDGSNLLHRDASFRKESAC